MTAKRGRNPAKPWLGWHVTVRGRLGYGDGRRIEAGKWLRVKVGADIWGALRVCRWGLHAGTTPWNGLKYRRTTATELSYVRLARPVKTARDHRDKACSAGRKVICTLRFTKAVRRRILEQVAQKFNKRNEGWRLSNRIVVESSDVWRPLGAILNKYMGLCELGPFGRRRIVNDVLRKEVFAKMERDRARARKARKARRGGAR